MGYCPTPRRWGGMPMPMPMGTVYAVLLSAVGCLLWWLVPGAATAVALAGRRGPWSPSSSATLLLVLARLTAGTAYQQVPRPGGIHTR